MKVYARSFVGFWISFTTAVAYELRHRHSERTDGTP